jgi:hypothetical protein
MTSRSEEDDLKVVIAILILAGLATLSFAVEPASLTPTEVEHLKLENAQLRAILAQQGEQQARQQTQAAMQSLNSAAEEVKAAHGWEDVQFDPSSLTFTKKADLPGPDLKAPVKK